MEAFESVLALVTSINYDYFPYNFEILQAYFLILDNIVSIDLKYVLLKILTMSNQQLWNLHW